MNFRLQTARLRLQSIVRKLMADSTVRGTVTLASCTALGAVLLLAAAPFVTRLFTPEVFGTVAVYTSIVLIGTPIACLRYDYAILLPEDDEQAANLLLLSLLLLLPVCGGLCLVALIWSREIASWLNAPALAPFLWLAPVGIFGAGAYQALSSWALRKQEYGKLARTRLTQNGGMALTQVGLGALLSGNPMGLLFGDLVSRFSGVVLLSRYAWPFLKASNLSVGAMRASAKRYKKFPIYSMPASLLTAIQTQIPTILLSRYFGPSVAGWYALTYRVLRAPTSFLGQAAAQSIFANAARMSQDRERLQQLTERATIVLMAVGLPIFALVIQEGPDLFSRAFGSDWAKAGLYARILAPWLFVAFVANPLANLLNVREWQGTTLLYSALECVTSTTCVMIGVAFHSDLVAFAVLGVGSCIYSVATMNRFFKAGFTHGGRIVKQAIPLLAPLALCVLLAEFPFGGDRLWPLLTRVLIFSVVYVLSLWKLRHLVTA